jgi:glucose-6-phosphate 1-dehydrogenase
MSWDPSFQFENPLEEHKGIKSAAPCIMVIFGATGDLTARKLLPALYNLARDGQLPAHFGCLGFARRAQSHDEFRNDMLKAVNQFSRVKPADEQLWSSFKEQLFYLGGEFDDDKGYDALHEQLKDLDQKLGTQGNRVFYLSTPPSYFPVIIEKLHKHGLIYDVRDPHKPWSRVIIEKPFGRDLKSAIQLNDYLSQFLDESQVYRIDHYLGKETVQNILVFRFANSIFESVWNNRYIDQIQITVAEEIGIGTRGHFWEEAGMLRDIIQNHMMQLVSLVAMEPPANLSAHAIHDEKVKVMESIRPIKYEIDRYIIRGQYGQGYSNGQPVKAYREEKDVSPLSNVETYVALEMYIDNWRWAGVPFYLRAGKRLPKRATEIAITFKSAPGYLFQTTNRRIDPDTLVIRIQPDEGISFKMNCKIPGLVTQIHPVKMDFRYGTYFGAAPPEAYERLLCDCMAGDATLFTRADEVLASWRLLTPILDWWKTVPPPELPNYRAGSWGPLEADQMLARNGKAWRLI